MNAKTTQKSPITINNDAVVARKKRGQSKD